MFKTIAKTIAFALEQEAHQHLLDLQSCAELRSLSLGQQGAHGFFHASVKGCNTHSP
jgi:hypothetical protein